MILGIAGLCEKLNTSIDRGLTPTDFEARAAHFGSNYKAPPRMTPYWKLFLGALDDFMLRFLLVCAVIELSIEVGFADAHERNTGKYLPTYHVAKHSQISLTAAVRAPYLFMKMISKYKELGPLSIITYQAASNGA